MTEDVRLGGRLWAFAAALGLALAGLWAWQDWAALAHLQLPDNDDMARLAQVRDWLDGQAFGDLVQQRLGDGVTSSLHWSRLGDAGLAAWMLALRPLLGTQGDVWAAILYPATLYFLYLAAAARLALRLGGHDAAGPAIVIAAFAFPAITMFVPGRIDHHGLQILLMLWLAEAVLRPPSARSGALTGLVAAASLAVGLEAAPQIVAAMAAFGLLWVWRGKAEQARLLAFGGVLAGATLAWRLVAQPSIWSPLWCDGFTPASFDTTLIAGGAFVVLGITTKVAGPRIKSGATTENQTRTPVTPAPEPGSSCLLRLMLAVVVAAAATTAAYATSSVCLSGPYGATDPLLRQLWMDHIREAQPLLASPLNLIVSFGALPLLGTLACACLAWRRRSPEWCAMLGILALSLAVAFAQLRGATMAAALAVAPLAVLVAMARAKGGVRSLAAWLGSLGIVWNIAGATAAPAAPSPLASKGASCSDWRTIIPLANLPRGTFVAPMDAGAYIIGQTSHRALAAPYHRSNAGNRATYDFWLSEPDAARAIAARWRIDYVLGCPRAFGTADLSAYSPRRMAVLLETGRHPDWLQPLPLSGSEARLYRVLRDQPAAR